MSRSFDGIDDHVDSAATLTLGNTVTMAAWIAATSQGEGDAGNLLFTGSQSRWRCGWNGTANSRVLRVQNQRATADSNWSITTPLVVVTGWKFVAFALDISLPANDPTVWMWEPDQGTGLRTLTVGSGLTRTATGSGANETEPRSVFVGNNAALSQTWAGRIGEFALWTSRLSTEEIAAIAVNGVLAATPPFLAWPMDSGAGIQDVSGQGRLYTVTGALTGENPPIRPAGRRG